MHARSQTVLRSDSTFWGTVRGNHNRKALGYLAFRTGPNTASVLSRLMPRGAFGSSRPASRPDDPIGNVTHMLPR